MGVQLSERAAKEVRKIMEEQNYPADTMLRVGVSGGGCSGFSYSLNFDQKSDEAVDDVYDFHGVKLVVDRKSDLYLTGTTVDFFDGLEKRGFVFNNPNATKTCGCGSSFSA
jgi:iron-sulfur cluster assembly protein